jgi:hypothetical protein
LDGYRSHRLTESEVRRLLGFEIRYQVHQFLASHGVDLQYTEEDILLDIAAANKLHAQRTAQAVHAE